MRRAFRSNMTHFCGEVVAPDVLIRRRMGTCVTTPSVAAKGRLRQLAIAVLITSCYAWSLQGAEPVQQTPIPVKPDAVTHITCAQAVKTEGAILKQAAGSALWKGGGSLQWLINVSAAGEYEINLCYSAPRKVKGTVFELACEKSKMSSVLEPTVGSFKMPYGDYERIHFNGRINLEAGDHILSMKIERSDAKPIMSLRSLELVPVSAKPAIEADEAEARHSRASTDWLGKAGYGLMFHWTSQCIGRNGTTKPFAEAVRDFDVGAFAKMVESTGAGYVLFTVGHAEPYCPAPLKSWEKFHPGKTTERDLIAEIAGALNARGVKLMCYFPTHVVTGRDKATEKEFVDINRQVMTEFGERYGKKVAGYWFDGWYQCYERYPDVSFKDFFKVCKAGNPDRIIALNSWVYPIVTDWQDYWAGEVCGYIEPPRSSLMDRGAGKGLPFQALMIMESYWVQQKIDTPPKKPMLKPEKLSKFIRSCMRNGGAVTINVGIYQDGTINADSMEVLREVRKRVRDTANTVEVEPGHMEETIALEAVDGKVKGTHLTYVPDVNCIACWTNPKDRLTWSFTAPASGRYAVTVTCVHGNGPSEYAVTVGSRKLMGNIAGPGADPDWFNYEDDNLGTVELTKDETCDVTIQMVSTPHGAPMNFRRITLQPVVEKGKRNERN